MSSSHYIPHRDLAVPSVCVYHHFKFTNGKNLYLLVRIYQCCSYIYTYPQSVVGHYFVVNRIVDLLDDIAENIPATLEGLDLQ